MTSIKIYYRPSAKAGAQEGKLFIRLIHRRRVRNIPTGYLLRPQEWDSQTETVLLPQHGSSRYEYLSAIVERLSADRLRLESLISKPGETREYDIEELLREFKGMQAGRDSLSAFCQKVCGELEEFGQERTARAYRSAVTSFEKFLPERPLTLSDINPRMMKDYETYLLGKGLHLNTVSFYMRQLRAVYHRAVREKLVRRQEDNPFGDVFTGVHKTRHRALTESELNTLATMEIKIDQRIGNLGRQDANNTQDLGFYLKLKKALLLFLFCFHARGMSYVDIAYLKKSDIGVNTIIYKRRKTGRFLEVGITRPMREIMELFEPDVKESPYVFPIISPTGGRERKQYENGLKIQNQRLGLLARMAGLNKKVTTHVSRHTWATVAKCRQVSVSVISEALGHRDAKTTEYYLASFDQSVLDKLSIEMSGVVNKVTKAA